MLHYSQILQSAPVIEDPNLHSCEGLEEANKLREADGERKIYIFRDVENQEFNLGVGLEFITIKHCPFCGKVAL